VVQSAWFLTAFKQSLRGAYILACRTTVAAKVAAWSMMMNDTCCDLDGISQVRQRAQSGRAVSQGRSTTDAIFKLFRNVRPI
jgi:hypothetical protein